MGKNQTVQNRYTMPIEYDYTQHILFKDGKEAGIKAGEERGELRKSEAIALNMLKKANYTIQEIVELTGLTESQVKELKSNI